MQGSDTDKVSRSTCAYLGPARTYGHQAAKLFVSSLDSTAGEIQLIPCPTISDIYLHPAQYLVMPLQNIIQGGVVETIDSLLSPLFNTAGPSTARSLPRPRIVADLDLPIRHSLVAKRGTRMEDIEWVRSHEQALGQSSAFLTKYLPRAKQILWASTAGAAMSLLTKGDDGGSGPGSGKGKGEGKGAAICSASAIEGISELEVLYEGTQAIRDNHTRFILLIRDPHPLAITYPSPDSPTSTSASRFYALSSLSLLSHPSLGPIRSIHTRPHPALATPVDRYPHLILVEVGPIPSGQRAALDESGMLYLGTASHLSFPP